MATFSNRSNDKFYDVYIKCAFRLARDFVYYRSIREYVSRWNFLITRVVYRNSAVEKYVFPFRYIYVFIYIRVCECALFDFSQYFFGLNRACCRNDFFIY